MNCNILAQNNEIKNHYGHFDLGVYAQVIKSGLVSINDSLEIK